MLGIALQMKKCYVDDINYGLPQTPPGVRYDSDELCIEEAMAVHVLMTEYKRTMQIITVMGNSIHGSIQLEYHCASLHDDKKTPILDLKVSVNGNNHIKQKFYTKDFSSKSVIQQF